MDFCQDGTDALSGACLTDALVMGPLIRPHSLPHDARTYVNTAATPPSQFAEQRNSMRGASDWRSRTRVSGLRRLRCRSGRSRSSESTEQRAGYESGAARVIEVEQAADHLACAE